MWVGMSTLYIDPEWKQCFTYYIRYIRRTSTMITSLALIQSKWNLQFLQVVTLKIICHASRTATHALLQSHGVSWVQIFADHWFFCNSVDSVSEGHHHQIAKGHCFVGLYLTYSNLSLSTLHVIVGFKYLLAEIFKVKCAPGFFIQTDFFYFKILLWYHFTIVLSAFAFWLIYSFLQQFVFLQWIACIDDSIKFFKFSLTLGMFRHTLSWIASQMHKVRLWLDQAKASIFTHETCINRIANAQSMIVTRSS